MYEKYISILAVGAFIFNEKDELLIVKKSPKEQIDAGLWTIPGGKVYPNEPILEALAREVKEEVRLDIITHTWIGEDVFVVSDRYFHAQHLQCTVKSGPVILEAKLTEYEWIKGDNVKKYDFPLNIKNRINELFKK